VILPPEARSAVWIAEALLLPAELALLFYEGRLAFRIVRAYRASGLTRIALGDDRLRIRFGLRLQADVPLERIASAEAALELRPSREERRSAAEASISMQPANVRIRLHAPCRVESFLFLPRNVEALYLTIDDPRSFAAALNRAIVLASQAGGLANRSAQDEEASRSRPPRALFACETAGFSLQSGLTRRERGRREPMYKLIAIDVDDTLLNDEIKVTDATKGALAAAMAQGVTVTLATGRMFASAQKIARQIELNVPIITYQGSLVKNLIDEQVLYERSVPVDAARKLFAFCEERGLHLQLYVNDVLYVKEDNEKARGYSRLSNIPFTVEPDFEKLLGSRLTKMLVIDDPALLDRVAEELQPLVGDTVHITKSKPHYLEFLHKEGTKGHALAFMAEHVGCTLDQVIAIGDAQNDREMLEVAGLGVAMGNAVPALKEIADYVTLSNNEDGVRHVIEKFVLNRQE